MSNYQLSINNPEVPEGYKKSEVGIIPEDWEVKKLQELIDANRKITYGIVVPGPNIPNGVPMIRAQDYSQGWVDLNELYRVAPKIDKSYKRSKVVADDILLTIVGSVGNLARVIPVFDGSNITQQTARLAFDKQKANGYFYLNILSSSFGQREITNYTKSGVQPSLNLSDIDKFLVPYPPLPEQRTIAQALSDVDALIAALDKLIAKKRHIKTATMQQLLTGKTRLPGFGEGKGYQKTDIGVIPEDWEVKNLKDIAPLQRGFDLPTSQLKKGDYPVVYSNGVMNYHSKFMVHGPGVITGRSGTIGNVHYVQENYWPHNTSLWVTDFKNSHSKYIYYLYIFLKIGRFGTGSGVPTLNRNDVHDFKTTIPTPSEQKAIAQVLSDIDEEITALEKRRTKTQAIKQGMMQELLTGRTRLSFNKT